MADCNVLLLNIELQEAFDAHQAKLVDGLLDEEQGIHVRSTQMSDLIRNLRARRIDKSEKDKIALDEDLQNKIQHFREVHWPALQERHSGIVTDDHNPFPNEIRASEVLGEEIDHMLDCLSTLLDQEQNSLSHITRKLKHQTDMANHCATMTAERAKQNPNRSFVRNQLTGIR